MKNWRILGVLLLCLALVSSIACSPFGDIGDEDEPKQQEIEVVRGDLTVSVSGSGNIVVSTEARLAFGTSGKVDEIYVEAGDEVDEGEVLVKLDTGALELALTQTEAALAQAEAALAQAQAAQYQAQAALDEAEYNLEQLQKRLNASHDRIRIAESQLEAAGSQLEAARLQLGAAELQIEAAEQSVAQAHKQLDEATITAPFTGMVVTVDVDSGDFVSGATPIVHLIEPAGMELTAGVDEIDIPDVQLGQSAIISVDALPALQLEGMVSYICPVPTTQAGVILYDVTIDFEVAEGSSLRVGMSATADIIISERSNVLLVPDRAIEQDSSGNPMVKVMVNGQIQNRPVVVGVSDGYQTEVVEGLTEGEVVVIER